MKLPPVVVALETSGSLGSVAVARDGAVVARRFLPDAREHAARAVPALAEALEDARVQRDRVGGVVVGAGPGSFTGVRVAAAIGKGLAHAWSVPLWAVSSLEAAAVSAEVLSAVKGPWPAAAAEPASDALRVVLFDARGRRVFLGAFEGAGANLAIVRAPAFSTLDLLLEDEALARALLCGDAALRHREELAAARRRVVEAPAGLPTADGLIARLYAASPPPLEDPFEWEPDYLRQTSAERERAREAPGVG